MTTISRINEGETISIVEDTRIECDIPSSTTIVFEKRANVTFAGQVGEGVTFQDNTSDFLPEDSEEDEAVAEATMEAGLEALLAMINGGSLPDGDISIAGKSVSTFNNTGRQRAGGINIAGENVTTTSTTGGGLEALKQHYADVAESHRRRDTQIYRFIFEGDVAAGVSLNLIWARFTFNSNLGDGCQFSDADGEVDVSRLQQNIQLKPSAVTSSAPAPAQASSEVDGVRIISELERDQHVDITGDTRITCPIPNGVSFRFKRRGNFTVEGNLPGEVNFLDETKDKNYMKSTRPSSKQRMQALFAGSALAKQVIRSGQMSNIGGLSVAGGSVTRRSYEGQGALDAMKADRAAQRRENMETFQFTIHGGVDDGGFLRIPWAHITVTGNVGNQASLQSQNGKVRVYGTIDPTADIVSESIEIRDFTQVQVKSDGQSNSASSTSDIMRALGTRGPEIVVAGDHVRTTNYVGSGPGAAAPTAPPPREEFPEAEVVGGGAVPVEAVVTLGPDVTATTVSAVPPAPPENKSEEKDDEEEYLIVTAPVRMMP